MSKNIKLIAGAGLAVAAASMASVSNTSALGFANIVTGFADGDYETLTISASDPDANYRNIDGSLKFISGSANITAAKSNGNVTDIYININGVATLDDGFASEANGIKIHVINNGTLTLNSTADLKAGTELVNNGTINIASTPVIDGTLTNKGTINVNAGALVVNADGKLVNSGTINVYTTSTLAGNVINTGKIIIPGGATVTVTDAAMFSNSGKVQVWGTLNLPADTARATGNFNLEIVITENGEVFGTINSASDIDIKSRIKIPSNIEGQGTEGINSVSYKIKLAKSHNGDGYHYTLDVDQHRGNTVDVYTDDNTTAVENIEVFNDNTTLHDYIREAFDHNIDVIDYLADAGISIEDLTPADIAYLVANSDLQDEHGYDYNYFEGWYSDAHYQNLANLEAKVKNDDEVFAYLSVRNRIFVGIGTKDEMYNSFDPADFDNEVELYRAYSKYVIFAKQGQKFGDIKPQIVAMLTAYNKANGTNYGISDILVMVDLVNYPQLNTTLIEGQRYARLDNILGLEVDDFDFVYILVGKNTVKPAASTSTSTGTGATLASVKAPTTGAISEATGSASSSNIFAVIAGAVVALGAAVAKLFKKSER